MRLLYHCDADSGGIAEYALRQVDALAEAGAQVTLLCRPTLPTARVRHDMVRAALPTPPVRAPGIVRRLSRQIADQRAVARIVEQEVTRGAYDAMLIACYAEYFSPFWAGIYRRIAKQVPIGTIAHDPVRDYVLGPRWWHRWSVRQAYSFVTHVFVHDKTPVDFGGPRPDGIELHVIPHGPFEVGPPKEGWENVRQRLGFADGDQVFLSFGQIRDGKNLDRFLRVMPQLPDRVRLLVAGSSGGGSQRQPEDYQKLAKELAVAERCVWDIRYVPDDETGDLFAAADYVLMSYSAKFCSASGVLNTAVTCRKLVLASAGDGPLKSAVQGYRLGVFVPPDNDAAILEGARRLIAEPVQPEWERYERENSWQENAKRVIEAFSR
jgi:glycosyltransferase involved in cell wall biosynthesis